MKKVALILALLAPCVAKASVCSYSQATITSLINSNIYTGLPAGVQAANLNQILQIMNNCYYNSNSVSTIILTPSTIAGLGTCSAANQGAVAYVVDTVAASTPTFHATVSGGGSTSVASLVSCNGTNWQYD